MRIWKAFQLGTDSVLWIEDDNTLHCTSKGKEQPSVVLQSKLRLRASAVSNAIDQLRNTFYQSDHSNSIQWNTKAVFEQTRPSEDR